MSRQIDPNRITPDDVDYLRQRPVLVQEFEMQGLGNPLAEDYPYLVDHDGNPLNGDAAPGADLSGQANSHAELKQLRQQVEDLQSQVSDLEDVRDSLQERLAEFEDADNGEELPEHKRWNDDMTKAQLTAVIEARNADYDDDEKIVMPEDKKDALVAALVQDDEDLASEE